jgi:hypothetical protein
VTRHGRTARTPLRAPARLREPPPPLATTPPIPGPGPRHVDVFKADKSREELLWRADSLLVAPTAAQRSRQHAGVGRVLDWLQGWPGDTWQDRWVLSSADEKPTEWGPEGVSQARRACLTAGLCALLTLRAIRPSYRWLFASRLLGAYDTYRRHNQSAVFELLHQNLSERGGNGEYANKALDLLTRMVIVTGKDLLDLDLQDVNAYAQARQASGRPLASLPLAYQTLHAVGGLKGAPATLAHLRLPGKLTPAELVDRYPIVDQAVRDVLVHYLAERAAVLDYGSLVNQSQMLVDLFWTDLERHHPGISSLNLADTQAHQHSVSGDAGCS